MSPSDSRFRRVAIHPKVRQRELIQFELWLSQSATKGDRQVAALSAPISGGEVLFALMNKIDSELAANLCEWPAQEGVEVGPRPLRRHAMTLPRNFDEDRY